MATINQIKPIELFTIDFATNLKLPIVENGISAGFPSPADDFLDISIDLNKYLIKNKAATFFGRVAGNSMIGAGLNNGDLLVVDKSIEPKNNKIAVCFIDGEFTIKRIKFEDEVIWLIPANKKYSPIKVTHDNDFLIWGIVTYVIKKV